MGGLLKTSVLTSLLSIYPFSSAACFGGSPFWFFAGNREAFAGDGASWGDLMEVGWKSGVSADTSGAGSPEESFGHSVTNWFFPSNRPEIFEQMIEQLMQGFQFCWRQA